MIAVVLLVIDRFYFSPLRAKYHKLKYGTELNQGEIKPPSYDSGEQHDIALCLQPAAQRVALLGAFQHVRMGDRRSKLVSERQSAHLDDQEWAHYPGRGGIGGSL